LTDVTFADKAGRALLATIASEGTNLIGTGLLCALVAEAEAQAR
jgi:hypothetical protein